MYVIITLPAPQHVNNSDRYINNIYTKATNIIKRSNFYKCNGTFYVFKKYNDTGKY